MPFTREGKEALLKELQDLKIQIRDIEDYQESLVIKRKIKECEKKIAVFKRIDPFLD
jgi:hypothetical protein